MVLPSTVPAHPKLELAIGLDPELVRAGLTGSSEQDDLQVIVTWGGLILEGNLIFQNWVSGIPQNSHPSINTTYGTTMVSLVHGRARYEQRVTVTSVVDRGSMMMLPSKLPTSLVKEIEQLRHRAADSPENRCRLIILQTLRDAVSIGVVPAGDAWDLLARQIAQLSPAEITHHRVLFSRHWRELTNQLTPAPAQRSS